MPRLQAIPASRLIYIPGDPGIPAGMEHDMLAGLQLTEGKAIGTAMLAGNVNSRDQFMRNLPRGQIQDAIERASRNAPRALSAVYVAHRRGLTEIVSDFSAQSITRAEARRRSAKLFRESYERVRVVARRASGFEELA
ncbi:MAG TPA: hypothetical protein VFH61_00305, partial [Thermoleophilia bacterium]|nr:hypothetical protein [Thermoleophilia bacterium]